MKDKRPVGTVLITWDYYHDDPAEKAVRKAFQVLLAAIKKLEPIEKPVKTKK